MDEEERQRRLMAAIWKPRNLSIASQLKDNSYYFKPPSRYIFPGAEVYERSPDDDDDDEDGADDSDSDSSSSGSSESPENATSGPENGGEDSNDEESEVA